MTPNNQIRQLRKQRKMSQEELAAAMNVSRQAISKWETGQCNPDTENLIRLAEVFEVDVNILLQTHKAKRTAPLGIAWLLSILLVLALAAAILFACLWQQEVKRSSTPDTEYDNVQMYSGLLRTEIPLTTKEQAQLMRFIDCFHFVALEKNDDPGEDNQSGQSPLMPDETNENDEPIKYGGRNYAVECEQEGTIYKWHFSESEFCCTIISEDGSSDLYHFSVDYLMLYELDKYAY